MCPLLMASDCPLRGLDVQIPDVVQRIPHLLLFMPPPPPLLAEPTPSRVLRATVRAIQPHYNPLDQGLLPLVSMISHLVFTTVLRRRKYCLQTTNGGGQLGVISQWLKDKPAYWIFRGGSRLRILLLKV